MPADYGRLLDLADEIEHRANQFAEAVHGPSALHHRLLKYQQLRKAVEDAGACLHKYEHQRAREESHESPPPKADKS